MARLQRIQFGGQRAGGRCDVARAGDRAADDEQVGAVGERLRDHAGPGAEKGEHGSPAVCRATDARLAAATRDHHDLRLGASPRATLHLLRAAKATAALDGRDHVLPDDVQQLAVPVLAHRLLLSTDAQIAGRTPAQVVEELVRTVRVPPAGM